MRLDLHGEEEGLVESEWFGNWLVGARNEQLRHSCFLAHDASIWRHTSLLVYHTNTTLRGEEAYEIIIFCYYYISNSFLRTQPIQLPMTLRAWLGMSLHARPHIARPRLGLSANVSVMIYWEPLLWLLWEVVLPFKIYINPPTCTFKQIIYIYIWTIILIKFMHDLDFDVNG